MIFYLRLLLIAALAFGLDQASKYYVVWQLDLVNIRAIDVLPPLLNFRMGWNTGINFGIAGGLPIWVLAGLAIAICIGLLIWARVYRGWWAAALFGMAIGGALGNVYDRITYGAVADFLNMSCCGWQNPTSFNVADIFVFTGLIGLAIFSEKLPRRA